MHKLLPALVICIAGAAAGQALADRPASAQFGAARQPAAGLPAVHGGFAAGCIAGAHALPESGPGWQALRLSRNRNWGHPEALAFIARMGETALELGWPAVLIGDIAQPRGGPMTFGHSSHQTGLDVDIWFRRPERLFSVVEREDLRSVSVVAPGGRAVSSAFQADHASLLRAAASDPAVERIFVNAAIKDTLCRATPAGDREWLRRIRPWWRHDTHFHVRLRCPADQPGCVAQAPLPPGDGCDETLAWWLSDEALNPPPSTTPTPARRELTLADLPSACAGVLTAP